MVNLLRQRYLYCTVTTPDHYPKLNPFHLAMLILVLQTFNLGSGVGVSVLQLLQTFGKVTGMPVAYEIQPRREGDIYAMYSNGERAQRELGWTPKFTLEQMCKLIP